MSALEYAIDISERRGDAHELTAANNEIAELHLRVVGRAVRLIDSAMRYEDGDAAHAITTTATLVPELSDRIADAIAGHLSSRWGLDVTVDAYTAAELDLSVDGPFEPSQTEQLSAFVRGVAWWPSKVSIMFGPIMAVDASIALQPERLSTVVQAVIASSSRGR
jgi:hypothetical protein